MVRPKAKARLATFPKCYLLNLQCLEPFEDRLYMKFDQLIDISWLLGIVFGAIRIHCRIDV